MKIVRYVSWSALFAGAIIGVGINFLLNLLALGLGLASFSIQRSGQTSISWLGFACFVSFALFAMFSTGWLAGKFSIHTLKNRAWGMLHGFLAWSILLIFTILLITNFIQYAAFHSNFTSNLVEIKIINHAPMLASTKAHSIFSSPLSFNIETHKKVITLNAWMTFVLFFIGALASMFGGWLGYGKEPKVREDKA